MILIWICLCYSTLSKHFIRNFSLWTFYQYLWWKRRLIAFQFRVAMLNVHRLGWLLSEWKSLIIDVWRCRRMPIFVHLLICTDCLWLFEERNSHKLNLIETWEDRDLLKVAAAVKELLWEVRLGCWLIKMTQSLLRLIIKRHWLLLMLMSDLKSIKAHIVEGLKHRKFKFINNIIH